MLRFILKRIAYGSLVMWGIVIAIFLMSRILPGDPVDLMAGQHSSLEQREIIRKQHGLDQSLTTQLVWYINDLSILSIHKDTPENSREYSYQVLHSFDKYVLVFKMPYFQRSYQSDRRVSELLFENLIGTLWLAGSAILLASILGVTLGLIASVNQTSVFDRFLMTFSAVGISIPSFVLAIVMATLFGYLLSDITGLSVTGYIWIDDPLKGEVFEFKNLILPSLTLSLRPLAVISMMTRNSMLEVLAMDYIRTAFAKGLPFHTVVIKHAFRNALNPIVTSISGWLANMMTGAFFVEYIFSWKGIGAITLHAVYNTDYPVIIGTTIFLAFIFVAITILVDILYHIIDPNVKLE